jgi:ribosomal protein S18 acetylase RimI-like enzyme
MHTIRRCRSDDFDAVLALLRQLWPARELDVAALRDVYRKGLASDRQAYLCAADPGEKLIAFGSLSVRNSIWQQGPLANVDELVVDEQWRGRGIGTDLLERLSDCAREMGCRRIELDSALHRKEAHAFYESRGFERMSFLFTRPLEE